MSIITRQYQYVAGNATDPDQNNANEVALYNEINGGLDNDNIASNASISESKVAFNKNDGHSHDGIDSKLIVKNRAFSWTIKGTLATGDAQGAQFLSPVNCTAVKLWLQTASGTAVIRVKNMAKTKVIIQSKTASSSVASSTDFIAGGINISAGDRIALDITGVSSGVDLFVTMECTEP